MTTATKNGEQATCGLCGEPMPPGEEMFKLHGYSGPCPVQRRADPSPPPEPQQVDPKFAAFTAALASFIQQHQPWSYSDVDRDSDEATDSAWVVAKSHGPALWIAMGPR